MARPTCRARRRPRRGGTTRSPLVVAGHDDAAKWSVPIGVRTASEWAWRAIVIAAALIGAIKLLTMLSEIVIPVIVALLLAALLAPIFKRLRAFMPSGAAAGLTVLGTLTILIGLLTFVGSQFIDQFDDIKTQVGEGYDQIRTWIMDTFRVNATVLDEWIEKARQQGASALSDAGPKAAAAGVTAGHAIAGFFIAMFTLFFFLHDGARIWAWVVRLFPGAARGKVHSSGIVAWGQLSAFTRATVLVAAADAIGIGLVAAVLGVPFASGVAILVFFGAFIPVIGAAISGAVPVLLALVALGPVKALIMLAGVIAVQQIESHLLQPLLLGRAVKVHPLSVILAIAAGVVLAGIVGALIAVPTVAVLNAVGHHLLDPPTPPTADSLLDAEGRHEAAEAREEVQQQKP
jgi:predicted PurR-regulated permease PerM